MPIRSPERSPNRLSRDVCGVIPTTSPMSLPRWMRSGGVPRRRITGTSNFRTGTNPGPSSWIESTSCHPISRESPIGATKTAPYEPATKDDPWYRAGAFAPRRTSWLDTGSTSARLCRSFGQIPPNRSPSARRRIAFGRFGALIGRSAPTIALCGKLHVDNRWRSLSRATRVDSFSRVIGPRPRNSPGPPPGRPIFPRRRPRVSNTTIVRLVTSARAQPSRHRRNDEKSPRGSAGGSSSENNSVNWTSTAPDCSAVRSSPLQPAKAAVSVVARPKQCHAWVRHTFLKSASEPLTHRCPATRSTDTESRCRVR